MAYRILALLGVVIVLAAAPAQAVNVKKSSMYRLLEAEQMIAALESAGATDLEETTDDQGDPMINASYEGISFAVLFYNCRDRGCEWGQFRASFERSDLSHREMLDIVNEWNTEWVFGKAYVNEEQDLLLEQPFVVQGGVSQKNLNHNTDEWLIALKRYAETLGWD